MDTYKPESRYTTPTPRCPHPERWTSRDDDSTEVEVAELLYGLIRSLQPDYCVETGTAFGEAAVKIGLALRRNKQGRLTTIELDPDRAYDARGLMLRLGLNNIVDVVTDNSLDWTPDSVIDFLFIDSSRSWPHRLSELDTFYPSMRKGGIICLHDTAIPEYREAIKGGRIIHLPTPRGLTLMEVT